MLAFGRRKMVMTETIIRNELPGYFEGTYEMKGVYNRICNTFESPAPGTTRWICANEFRFSGLMRLIAAFMKGSFKKQSEMIMGNFKRFAEASKSLRRRRRRRLFNLICTRLLFPAYCLLLPTPCYFD